MASDLADGYYWIRTNDMTWWTIAQKYGDAWFTLGGEVPWERSDIDVIGPRIHPPEDLER